MIAAFLLRFWPHIALVAVSAGLCWQIGQTAKQRAANQELIAVNASQTATIGRLRAESQLNEVTVINGLTKREVIHETHVAQPVSRIRQIISQAPPMDCVVSDMPDSTYKLFPGPG